MTKIGIMLCVALMLAGAQAHAQAFDKYDTAKPITIDADSLEVLQQEQRAVFRGNVVATQGDVRLKADAMTVHYSGGAAGESSAGTGNNISRIEVVGNAFLATPSETAKGDKGVYDVSKKVIRLMGNVVLTRGQNVLKGSAAEYNLSTGKSLMTGGVSAIEGKNGGRVRGLFVPNQVQ